jgi:hypothetical protein
MRQPIDIDAVFEQRDGRRNGAPADLHQIRAARHERVVAHPDYMRGELIDAFGRRVGVGEKIAPRDVDLILEDQRNRLALPRPLEDAVESDDLLQPRATSRPRDHHLVTRRDRARNDSSREAAKVAIRAIDPLHLETKWPLPDVV